ncbi:GntR family transcriptional regulator [Paenibacillus rigui]|uniref:GntR family transcriptional regulator n=1 Tax=Paenibacillus rigui TaxID=554312 RepID=A0A229URA5_9BACL|nr:GntR family transcriptional regulator [Paenibacillus rigui]OXM85781.1 GntR family transcriptional regulator [Paenibacillus rigui]
MNHKNALYKQIQEHIKEKIQSGELRPKDRVPSEQEIMEEYKVSKITVKNALTALADEGYVIRVQGKGTFVTEQPFHANRMKQLAPSKSPANLIGFIIPTLKTGVIQKLVDHVEYYLTQAGFQMVFRITRESSAEESRAIKDLMECGVKGLIVFPTEDEKYSESLLRLSLDKFPFVFIDRYLRNIDTYTITSDNLGGAYETVSYLLGKGHRQIALISPENTNTAVEDRTAGFEKAYTDQGVSIDKGLWCHVPLDILRSNDALSYITDFLRSHPQLTAAFTMTAEMARLTSRALQGAGSSSSVKELISFDDPELPHVPYIAQNESKMAEAAVDLLIRQIDSHYEPQQVVIPVKLILANLQPAY